MKIFTKKGAEDGVTLVISIVLLASVTFITFALSTLLLREIGATRLILLTEPALSGANAGGEVGLFRLFREVGSVGTSGQLQQSGASYEIVPDLYDDPYLFTVAPQATITVGLYDAENPANKATGYGSVTIINNNILTSRPINVTIVSWADPSTILCGFNLGVGQSQTCSALNSMDDRYLITITNTANSGNATGQIQAFDESGQPKGVPSASPDLQVTGRSGQVQRKIEIILE